MTKKKAEDRQGFYICGRCKTEQYYLVGEERKAPCNVCGYLGYDRDYQTLPSDIKLDISKY